MHALCVRPNARLPVFATRRACISRVCTRVRACVRMHAALARACSARTSGGLLYGCARLGARFRQPDPSFEGVSRVDVGAHLRLALRTTSDVIIGT